MFDADQWVPSPCAQQDTIGACEGFHPAIQGKAGTGEGLIGCYTCRGMRDPDHTDRVSACCVVNFCTAIAPFLVYASAKTS